MKRTYLTLVALAASAAWAQDPDWTSADAIAAAAVASSPAIRVLDARIEAAREAVRSAGTLPNPMAMGGVQNLGADLANDPMMTMYMVGLSQTILPESRRESLREAAAARLRALEAERASVEAEVARDARAAWIELASLDARTGVLDDVLTLTDAMIAAARARYEAGSAVQADVIRAQLARSDLRHQLLTLAGRRRAVVGMLTALLDLPTGTEVPPLSLPHDHTGLAAPAGGLGDDHPAIRSLLATAAAREADLALARSATRPDFSIEASYSFRTETDDMISVLGRIELPVRRKSAIDPRIREAVAERDAALARVDQLRRSLRESDAVARAVLDEALEQIRFHDQVLVPQARLAFESTLAAYQTGSTPFESLLGAETAYVRLATDSYQFLERALAAITDLEALAAGARTIRVGSTGMNAPSASTAATPSAGSGSMGSM